MTLPGTSVEVGLKEASRLTGLSLSTLRRRREELRTHGATQHADGSWTIPVHALVALGLLDRVTPGDPPPAATPDAPVTPQGETLRKQLQDAERRALEAEKRAAVAEAVAAERERALAIAERTLLMLTDRPHPAPAPAPAPEPAPAPAPEPVSAGTKEPALPDSERPATGGWLRRWFGG